MTRVQDSVPGGEPRYWKGIPLPPLPPLEYWAVNAVVLHGSSVNEFTYDEFMEEQYGVPWVGGSATVIDELVSRGYLTKPDINTLRPTVKALKLIDPFFKGANAGGPKHREVVWKASVANRLWENYAVPDTGARVGQKRMDLFVMRPKNPRRYLEVRTLEDWDRAGTLTSWDSGRRFAIEVELQLSHNPKRIVQTFNKDTYGFKLPVVFIVPSKDMETAHERLKETNAEVVSSIRDFTKVGRVMMKSTRTFRWLTTLIKRKGLFGKEPLDRYGNKQSPYCDSPEDEGWGQVVTDRLEDGDLEDLREHAAYNPAIRRTLRRRGLWRDDEDYEGDY